MKHLGDITKINGYDAPPVNVIIGGSPCQDLSVAGKRAGLAGERSGLFMEQIRIIKEMREESERSGATDIKPRFMVWENVPGALSSNKGQDFRAVLEETARIVEKNLPDLPIPPEGWHYSGLLMGEGWSVVWRIFDAQFWGVPQRRRRIALVADFGGYAAPEILFERKGVFGDSPPSGTPWKDFTAALAERFGGTNTARENGTAAGFNGWKSVTGSIQYQEERSPTIEANMPPNVVEKTYCIQGNCIDRADTAGCNGRGWTEGVSYTLNTVDRPAVYDARGNGDGETAPTITGDHNNRVTDYTALCVLNQSTVRRLTPLECERLQGFPDNWTQIGELIGFEECEDELGEKWKIGIYEYIDSNGKKRKTSDSARYRALGNSIALPSWVWVLERLSYCCGADRTMASLFDGIGGFPLIWETLNGEGTCIWASEIEEFPIAVTKYHFCEEAI